MNVIQLDIFFVVVYPLQRLRTERVRPRWASMIASMTSLEIFIMTVPPFVDANHHDYECFGVPSSQLDSGDVDYKDGALRIGTKSFDYNTMAWIPQVDSDVDLSEMDHVKALLAPISLIVSSSPPLSILYCS
jgi:hypothetical protein